MGASAESDLNAYRAGWTRVVLGVFGLVVVPLALPALAQHRWLFACYLGCALPVQVLIKRRIGGEWRAIGQGLVDVAFITYLVQRIGSTTSILVSAYVLIGVLNALVTRPWVARTLAAVAGLGYALVLGAEAFGALPFAPDGGAFGIVQHPTNQGRLVALLSVAMLLGVSTTVVSRLTQAVKQREHELMRANEQLEELSQRDPLTQLYNRRHLVARIEAELARVRRGHPMAVLMIDLDGFKRVNDRHGHLTGDKLLVAIARELQQSTRATDVCGRFGGDEFVVVVSDAEGGQAEAVADRLVAAVRSASRGLDVDETVTASIGIAAARSDDDVMTVIKRADELAYTAKQRGGDRSLAAA